MIDPWQLPAEDQHDPSVALRTAVMALMPVDMFPYGSVPARNCDIDHTIAYQEGVSGQTRWGNLAPLSRRAHRAKTFGGWTMSQPEPGVVLWTSPGGFQYLVTTHGTIRITRPAPPVRVEEPPPPWLDPPEPPDDPPFETTSWEWIQHAQITAFSASTWEMMPTKPRPAWPARATFSTSMASSREALSRVPNPSSTNMALMVA